MHIQSDFDFQFNNPDEKEADIGKKDKKISAVKFPLNQVKLPLYKFNIIIIMMIIVIVIIIIIIATIVIFLS